MNKHLTYLIFVLAVVFTSCSTSKRAVDGSESIPNRSVDIKDGNAVLRTMTESYNEWQDVQIPFSATLEGGSGLSMSGRATIIRGQSIRLSMRVFGMEVALCYIDKDTTYIVDKYHKNAYRFPTKSLTGGQFTLTNLQDILFGCAVYPNRERFGESDASLFSFKEEEGVWTMTPRDASAAKRFGYTIDRQAQPTEVMFYSSGTPLVRLSFSDRTITTGGYLASNLTLSGEREPIDEISGSIKWNYGKAKWNEGLADTPPDISGYTIKSPDKGLEVLKNL